MCCARHELLRGLLLRLHARGRGRGHLWRQRRIHGLLCWWWAAILLLTGSVGLLLCCKALLRRRFWERHAWLLEGLLLLRILRPVTTILLLLWLSCILLLLLLLLWHRWQLLTAALPCWQVSFGRLLRHRVPVAAGCAHAVEASGLPDSLVDRLRQESGRRRWAGVGNRRSRR